MRAASTAAGALLALGLAAALPLTLRALPAPIDLQVNLAGEHPFEIVEQPGLASPSLAVVNPRRARRGAATHDLPAGEGPGLHLRTWQITYGNRWDREVTLPRLVGPLDREGTETCGLHVRLGAGLFDTAGAGAGLKEAAHEKLSAHFPFTVSEGGIQVTLPKLRETDLQITLKDRAADVAFRITLVDSTVLSARFPARLVSRDGSPAIERAGAVKSSWTGPTRDQARRAGGSAGASLGGGLGALAGFLLGGPQGSSVGESLGAGFGSQLGTSEADMVAEERSHREITKRIDEVLSEMTLGLGGLKKPLAPLPGRPADQIILKLASNPAVSPGGIALDLCATVRLSEPRINAAVLGPARTSLPAPVTAPLSAASSAAAIELTMDASALNQALYIAWQSGLLRELGRSSAVLEALPPAVRDLAFDVTGFDPGLPPAIIADAESAGSAGSAESDLLPVLLADIGLGTWGARRVTGHASALLDIHSTGGDIELTAALRDLRVNCVERPRSPGAGARLTPCLSELLPTARETLIDATVKQRLPGGELLGRLPREPFKGLHVTWSDLTARLSASPPGLRVRVRAETRRPP